MVLNLMRILSLVAVVLLVTLAAPGSAHKDHDKKKAEQQTTQVQQQGAQGMPGMMAEHGAGMEMMDERPTTFAGRTSRFLGAMHPFAVHFPIALIPTSWVALLIARRRGHAVDVMRAIIILAGVAAVGAALLGWFSAGFTLTDEDPIQAWHRWLGTALAIAIAGTAVWAWRNTTCLNSRAITWVLGASTLALLVQGWLGGVLTHGLEHMSF